MSIDWQSPQTHILIGLMAPAILTGMSHHMFTVAMPSIRQTFALDADMTAWVVMVYSLPFMTLMPLYGRLGDKLGKRRLLLLGIALFLMGSALAMISTSLPWLMLGRFVEGVGAAGFIPLCLAIISQRFAPEKRGNAMGVWNSAIPLTGMTVPFIAGLLIDSLGWRAIYPPIFVAGILAVIIIRRTIQPLTTRIDFQFLRSFDWAGVALLSGSLASLLFYTSSRPITGVPALHDVRLLALCLLLFLALIVWERRHLIPYINLTLFTNRTFTVASVSAGLRMFLMSSVSFLIPLYLTDIHGSSASVIGIVLMLQAAALFLTSRFGGQLADRWGSQRPVTLSMVGLVGIMALLASFPASIPLWPIIAAGMGHGFLIGLSLAPLHRAAMHGVGEAEVGIAAGLYSLVRFAGQILGTAVAGVLLQQGLDQLQAPIEAYQQVLWVFTGVALLATLIGWFLRET
jgi:EmrB/QacA subfamily drug resistance transporter